MRVVWSALTQIRSVEVWTALRQAMRALNSRSMPCRASTTKVSIASSFCDRERSVLEDSKEDHIIPEDEPKHLGFVGVASDEVRFQ